MVCTLDSLETLISEVSKEVPVIEGPLLTIGYEGLYRDGRIYIEDGLPVTIKKERVVEEYTHHLCSVGEIVNYNTFESRKQEAQARKKALELLVPLDKLIECSFSGCSNKYECAEFLEITIETLGEAIQHYTSKYGPIHLYEGKIIRFNGDSIWVIDTGKQ